MKRFTDEEIQKMLEAGLQSEQPQNEDMRVYQTLFAALQEPPSGSLPADFADKVITRTHSLSWSQQLRRNWLLSLLAVLAGVVLSLGVLAFYQMEVAGQLLQLISEFRWILIFAFALFVAIQLADYRLLGRKMNTSSV